MSLTLTINLKKKDKEYPGNIKITIITSQAEIMERANLHHNKGRVVRVIIKQVLKNNMGDYHLIPILFSKCIIFH